MFYSFSTHNYSLNNNNYLLVDKQHLLVIMGIFLERFSKKKKILFFFHLLFTQTKEMVFATFLIYVYQKNGHKFRLF